MEKQYHSIFKQIGKNRFYTACNATCSGRIQNGTEFFCGDGVVQKKSGDTSGCGTNGANCVEVTSEYPGPGWTGDASTFTSEACDSDTDTNKLCNLAKGTNRSDYYENSNITCSDSCTIVNADQCGYCGDNKRQSNETCDKDSSGNIITAAGTYGKTCNNETITSSKTWKAPATGKYKIEVYGAQGGSGNGETGGKGAKVWGTFELTKGNSLYIKVGAKGEDHGSLTGGNGGGGSAVSLGNISSIDALLLVAGGGGGGGGDNVSGGQASNDGSSSGGLNPNVTAPTTTSDGAIGDGGSTGGKGWNSGWDFSGGTGVNRHISHDCSSDEDYAHGGGGGGYTGGSGAWSNNKGGGGGGSYAKCTIDNTTCGWTENDHEGEGEVVITQIQYKNCTSSCAFSYANCVNN